MMKIPVQVAARTGKVEVKAYAKHFSSAQIISCICSRNDIIALTSVNTNTEEKTMMVLKAPSSLSINNPAHFITLAQRIECAILRYLHTHPFSESKTKASISKNTVREFNSNKLNQLSIRHILLVEEDPVIIILNDLKLGTDCILRNYCKGLSILCQLLEFERLLYETSAGDARL